MKDNIPDSFHIRGKDVINPQDIPSEPVPSTSNSQNQQMDITEKTN